jgi:putative redox protein
MSTLSATLKWESELRFVGEIGATRLTLDANAEAGPTPVDALVLALAGCMAVDVVDILTKGRHPVRGLDTAFAGERAPDPPRRLVSASLTFTVSGAVPEAAIDRAIQLSRDKYCSVWHSLRQDIVLETRFVVRP